MTDQAMLTTIDNPYNPFKDWDEWFEFDASAGYHTPSLLARVAITSDELSEVEQDIALNDAMNTIVQENVSGVHKMVYEDSVVVAVDLASITKES